VGSCRGGRAHAAIRPRLVVAALAPLVLEGCYACCGGEPYTARRTEAVSVPVADHAAALGDDGVLDAVECEALCREFGEVLDGDARDFDCTDRVLTTSTGDTAAADTGGAAVHLACAYHYTAQELCTGRFHAATPTRVSRAADRGAWLAAAAHDEAASVKSFLALASELARHDAPDDLVVRARAAALDEVRHARAMGALAREHGAVPIAPRFRDLPERDLLAIAVENAVEGCVRETFAAFVAHHQARRASARFRGVFARIAEDETRHAQWSWDLDAWLVTRLSAAERRQVAEARRAALAALGSLGPRPRGLGLPSPGVARRMARRFAAVAA
jgi:hypothetical protein